MKESYVTLMTSPDPEQAASEAQRHIDRGNLAKGISILRQAVRHAENEYDLVTQGALLSRLGMAQKRAGDPACRDTLLQAVSRLKQADAKDELAIAWGNLGFIESELGNLEEARRCHEEALQLARSIQNLAAEAHALVNLCILYKDLDSQLTKALAYGEQALRLLVKQDNPQDRAHTLLSLGLIYERLTRTEEARQSYEQALALYREVGDRENEALSLHNLALLFDRQGHYQEALDFYRQSLEINLETGSKWGIAADLSALGSLVQGVDEWEQAKQFHEAAYELQKKIGDRRGQIDSLTDLGIVAGHQGDYTKALRYLNRALRLTSRMFDLQGTYEAYLAKGDIQVWTRQPRRAVDSYIQAVNAIEAIRARLLMEQESLAFFTQDRLLVYERLVYVCWKMLHLPKEALMWGERSKMREFLRRLGTTELAVSGRVPAALAEKEAQLFIRLRDLAEALKVAGEQNTGEDPVGIVSAYEEAEAVLRDVWTAMAAYDAEYVDLRRGEPASFQDLRQCLAST